MTVCDSKHTANMRSVFATASALLLVAAANASPVAEADLIPDVIEERAGPKRFNYYEMPTKNAGPCDLTTGPDGTSYWSPSVYQALTTAIQVTSGSRTSS